MSLSRHASVDTMTLSRHISLDAISVSRHISLILQRNIEPIGSVVAFEGHPEVISTQLRLLPTSPQILILPSIQCYLPIDELEQNFEAHTFIRSTVDAVRARHDTARAFLQGSTPNSKRLVFMNGGTPSAQALCIRAIMKHETEGDDIKAEAIFNLLVKDGVAGLDNHGKEWKRTSELGCPCVGEVVQRPQDDEQDTSTMFDRPNSRYDSDDDEYQDPITRAMRAADALDRQTASLQPSNDLDLTAPFRPRSMSLPLYGYSDNLNDAAPFFVFGSHLRSDSEVSYEEVVEEPYVPTPPNFSITHYDPEPTDSQALYPGFSDVVPPRRSPSCVGETYHPSTNHQATSGQDALTPGTDVFSPGPDNVVYGEASLLDMRASGRMAPVMRVRSLDRIYPDSPKFRDLGTPREVEEDEEEDPMTPKPTRPKSFMVVTDERNPLATRVNYIEGPRTIVVGPKKLSPITVAPVPSDKKRKPARTSYVDRGTDAVDMKFPKEPFQPVLPFTEDLVVYFKGEATDALLDAMVDAFKLGMYPVLSDSVASSEDGEAEETLRGTPEPHAILEVDESQDMEEPGMVPASADVDDYDPFAYVQPSKPPPKKTLPTVTVEGPPTPAQTPPPSLSIDKTEKFHDFVMSPNQTAVAIQNSLRSILNVYFPRETQGYNQFQFSLLPELEGLWKPIFREAEPGSSRKDNRRMDQIVAIGSQKGVDRVFSAAITGQLEKLGTKSSGVTRSGRLDFRYLLANAMQAFTAQPLTSQTSDNPFNNSYLLATLIIPHLETYLALNSEVRYLLLDYPQEHLPTILALQKLVGVDLMKVAQVLDSKSKDLMPFTHIRGASISNSSVTSVASSFLSKPLPPSPRSSPEVTVSNANYLLTSTASDAEIATFISTIWKILSEVSDFYTPPEPPKDSTPNKIARKQLKPSNINTSLSAFPRATAPQSPLSPVPPSDPPPMPAPARPVPQSLHHQASFPKLSPSSSRAPSFISRAPSFTETIKTLKSVRSKHSRNPSRSSRRRAKMGDAASVFTFDPAEDSDYDMEERRLMPIFMQKPRTRKPNSRKALKFLGLA